MMHARGLGDDGPALMGDKDIERFAKIELQAGHDIYSQATGSPDSGQRPRQCWRYRDRDRKRRAPLGQARYETGS
jgi:hypothetical protein